MRVKFCICDSYKTAGMLTSSLGKYSVRDCEMRVKFCICDSYKTTWMLKSLLGKYSVVLIFCNACFNPCL